MPASPKSHTSNMSSIREESAPIADASALEITKPTQAGFTFLSLPPEIRNMIYHYIFTSVRDGNCWAVYTTWDDDRLQFFRRKCTLCLPNADHATCLATYIREVDLFYAFDIPHNSMQPSILRTCSTILKEASPVAMAHLHVSISSSFSFSTYLEQLLACMRQPEDSYLSKLTYRCYVTSAYENDLMIRNFKQIRFSIGHLVLYDFASSTAPYNIEHFVTILDSLKHKPARVEWLGASARVQYRHEIRRVEFNEAARKWLVQLAMIKTADCNARLPRLREFLPQYFDKSSN
ncbi:hypothetical protein KCU78_g4224, partial [Aureobasidium melanogenum]